MIQKTEEQGFLSGFLGSHAYTHFQMEALGQFLLRFKEKILRVGKLAMSATALKGKKVMKPCWFRAQMEVRHGTDLQPHDREGKGGFEKK